MEQLKLNIIDTSEVKIIASAAYNFRIELIINLGKDDLEDIFMISDDLAQIFDNSFLLNEKNISKYFNKNTLPFVARYKGQIIGYIIGIPIEFFKEEAWARHDRNMGKNNTIYTYAFIMKEKYRNVGGYAKTLKRIYLNWAKKNGFKYVTGHVKQGITQKFKGNIEIIKIFPKWYGSNLPFEFYRRNL